MPTEPVTPSTTGTQVTATEADTCHTFVGPKLYAAGWTNDQVAEQRTFTARRILVAGRAARHGKPKRADYLLYYKPSFPLAATELQTLLYAA